MLTGAQIVIKCLEDLGVKAVFGYIGNSIMPIFEAISHSNIALFTPTSEIGATHMADGYSRASSNAVGVVMATSGPGATNLVTGIATAYMDSVPLLAITANVATQKLGKDSFQEIDTTGITIPITKYSHIVNSVNELEYQIKRAYTIACTARKGTVLIDIPCNILQDYCEYQNILPKQKNQLPISMSKIDAAANLINKAKQPLILAGGGALDASAQICALANRLSCPILTSLRAVGTIDSPYYVGLIGSAAPQQNNKLFNKADVVIAVGTRFSDKLFSETNKNKAYIHIDIDNAELYKIIAPIVAVQGDSACVISALLPKISARQQQPPITTIKKHKTATVRLAEIINSCLDDNTIIATDVGAHQLATLNALTNKNYKDIISSVGLGTMGYGLPAAIGAHIATNKKVVLATSDGSLNMSVNELISAVKFSVPLTIVIFNNHCLKMIKDIQTHSFNKNYVAVATPNINYVALAKALGAKGVNATLKSVKQHIQTAINGNNVTVINVNLR